MTKKIVLTLVGLLVVIALLAGVKIHQFKKMGAQQYVVPPETVSVAAATESFWEPTLNAIGSVAAVQGVTVSSEVAGKVVRINFKSGALVQAGDLLVELDAGTEQAQLVAAEASARLAEVNLRRARELIGQRSIAQAELDAAEAQALEINAQVESIRATIAKKVIRAPFAGRLGIRQVNLGQYLGTGDPIVVLQSLDPVYIDFSLPQQEISRLAPGMPVRAVTDAFPEAVFEGAITAISPVVDTATRNMKVQATFRNGDEKLRAGMFARVAVVLPEKQPVLGIPGTAVIYAPYGDSVFIVEPAEEGEGLVARQQFVRLGVSRGDFVAVTQGLKAGEQVVTTGAFKLRNGAAVVIDNTLSPPVELAPQPTDS